MIFSKLTYTFVIKFKSFRCFKSYFLTKIFKVDINKSQFMSTMLKLILFKHMQIKVVAEVKYLFHIFLIGK